MSSWVRRVTLSVVAGSVLLVAAAGSSDEPAPFSRSRWIAERSKTAKFSSEGVLPAEGPVPASALEKPAVPPITAEARKGRKTWVRVSRDILRPDGGTGQAETQAEPFLAIDPENDLRLLAGYQEGRFAEGGARSLTWAFSKNGGRAWREGAVPGLTHASGGAFEKASDPWVAYGLDGRAYYASLLFNETSPENGIYVSTSEDGGRTWGPPVVVHNGDATHFEDKQSMIVDNYADSPFRGRIYVTWDTVSETNQILRVARSEDGGQSFRPVVSVEGVGANFGALPLVGPGGVVHLFWMHATAVANLAIYTSRSEDGGVTWSPKTVVAPVSRQGVENLRTGELPSAAIDPRTGRIYVVWPDSFFTGGDIVGSDEIALVRSDDGGRTWTSRRKVSDDQSDASFTPAVAVDGHGRVAVSYYGHHYAKPYQVDHYVVISKDGESFGASRRSNGSSFDARFASVTDRGFFLGDYQGLVGGRNLFYALWVGTLEPSLLHKGERQPDAFMSKIP
ncbi:MAG TPA: sialidase family protein [Thermoanaerobaculia bacterium]|nr:sialidase family protein [Thermoanaerobaculia bacterium]